MHEVNLMVFVYRFWFNFLWVNVGLHDALHRTILDSRTVSAFASTAMFVKFNVWSVHSGVRCTFPEFYAFFFGIR